jgi:hypothetical protein
LLNHAITRAPALGISTLPALTFAHNGPSVALFSGRRLQRLGDLPASRDWTGCEGIC